MTAFFTRCWKRPSLVSLCARVFMVICALALGLGAAPARADSVDFREARLAPRDEGWALEAEFDIELSGRLEEAVNKGVALYFTLEFELTRPRWYWLDEKAAQLTQSYKLDYHALTRQYRLSAGASSLYFSFPTLTDALKVLSQPKLLAVDRAKVKPGDTYVGNVRMRLDVSRLPKPFQIETLTNREWVLDSDWKKFSFRPEAPAAAAAGAPTGAAGGMGSVK